MQLLGDDALEDSPTVANCQMNRERVLTGSNGYSRDLGTNPLELLKGLLTTTGCTRWLDLCCGTGRALSEAAALVESEGLGSQVEIVGVDLVDAFTRSDSSRTCLRFLQASLSNWEPDRPFALITCVHGLHYIGDKLGLIARAITWLTDNGRFVANLDMKNFKLRGARSGGRIVANE